MSWRSLLDATHGFDHERCVQEPAQPTSVRGFAYSASLGPQRRFEVSARLKTLASVVLAGAVSLIWIAVTQAADLPTKKEAAASSSTSCLASFQTWLNASAADCPLTYAGITVYGRIDMGVGYETNGAKFSPDLPQWRQHAYQQVE